MKVIFLDMDGVLNSHAWFQERKANGKTRFEEVDEQPLDIKDWRAWTGMVDPKAVARLNQIIEATGAKVVISSSWRHAHTTVRMDNILRFHGFRGEIVGNTPTLPGPRGDEIRAYVETNPRIKAFVILDDGASAGESGMAKWFVHTDMAEGLQDAHVERAIAILSG